MYLHARAILDTNMGPEGLLLQRNEQLTGRGTFVDHKDEGAGSRRD
jgi:hypothetical protein